MLHLYQKDVTYRKDVTVTGTRRTGLNRLFVITLLGLFVCVHVIDNVISDFGTFTVIDKSIGNFRTLRRSLVCSQGKLNIRLGKFGRFGRRLCEVETELETKTFREAFPEANLSSYTADYITDRPGGSDNIAFVVTIPSCSENNPGDNNDPGSGATFYDAAAVLRDSICNCTSKNPDSGSNYTSTMYAVIHPDAINCAGPDDGASRRMEEGHGSNGHRSLDFPSYNYDRVAILEELGYWVIIWGYPIDLEEISDSTLRNQIDIQDLMKLYAYKFTNHPVAVMTSFDTIFTAPVDSIVNQIVNDPSTETVYHTKSDGTVNTGTCFCTPSDSTYNDIVDTVKTTTFDRSLIASSGGLLTYFYNQNTTKNVETDGSGYTVLSFEDHPICGKPWDCNFDETWDNETKAACAELNHEWYKFRQQFEEEHWSKTDIVNTTENNYYVQIFLGYCAASGNYIPAAGHGAPVSLPPISQPPVTPPREDYWSVWKNIEDSHALENANTTCFEQLERLGITTSTDNDGLDFFTITPDPWVSGGLRFGCVGKDENYQCNRSCFPFDTTTPDWSDKLYLTMLAKVEGGITATCKPTITLSGGGWPRHASNAIILEESYVDAGYLTSDEWRRVLIPLENFKTAEWDLSNMYGMYFQRCPNHSGAQPTYHIASVAITNTAIDLVSTPPSSAPSAYTTDDPLLATHRIVHPNHHNWWPIFGADREPAGNFWVTAENNAWPSVPATTNPQTATVYIPAGQSVFYSGADTVKYDKIIVEGSLTIQPFNADVSLIVSTIVVEEGGSLDILTEATSSNTVEIQIEGALDFIVDPEQVLLGIIGLSGNVTIQGNEVQTKMATLYQDANAGTPYFVVGGMNLGFAVGGELVLPDTQTDLDVGHYLFGRSSYVDQTETCTIVSIDSHAVGVEETTITCDSPLAFNHSLGSNAAYVSRSIHILTSPASTDRGHILHTGTGKFEVRNACIEGFGRTTTELIDSTVMSPTDLKFGTQDTSHLIKQFEVEHIGVNQVARYAVHAHHSRVEAYLTGLAIIQSPRDGMVAHDSRVHILNNVIVGADGAGIFLEDGTETGPVKHNYIIGTGGGTRGGDDGRFSIQKGKDMAHGGFGIWARGKLALVQGNHAEGHFGFAAYSFFVHPNFISDKVVPDVPGTPSILVGKKRKDIPGEPDGTGLHLQTYGGFIDNTAAATFKVGIDMSYFSSSLEDTVGSIIEGARIRNLAKSGFGLKTTHSRIFTLNDVVIEGTVSDNTIIGIWCNNLNCGPGCMLQTPNTTLIFNNVQEERDGNSC